MSTTGQAGGLFAGHPVRFAEAMARGVWRAKVVAVRDGDTVVALVDRGFDDATRMPLRVAGLNTPELVGGAEASRVRARAAKARTADLALDRWALVRTYALPSGAARATFDRIVASVLVVAPDGTEADLAAVLLAEGLADRLELPR